MQVNDLVGVSTSSIKKNGKNKTEVKNILSKRFKSLNIGIETKHALSVKLWMNAVRLLTQENAALGVNHKTFAFRLSMLFVSSIYLDMAIFSNSGRKREAARFRQKKEKKAIIHSGSISLKVESDEPYVF